METMKTQNENTGRRLLYSVKQCVKHIEDLVDFPTTYEVWKVLDFIAWADSAQAAFTEISEDNAPIAAEIATAIDKAQRILNIRSALTARELVCWPASGVEDQEYDVYQSKIILIIMKALWLQEGTIEEIESATWHLERIDKIVSPEFSSVLLEVKHRVDRDNNANLPMPEFEDWEDEDEDCEDFFKEGTVGYQIDFRFGKEHRAYSPVETDFSAMLKAFIAETVGEWILGIPASYCPEEIFSAIDSKARSLGCVCTEDGWTRYGKYVGCECEYVREINDELIAF